MQCSVGPRGTARVQWVWVQVEGEDVLCEGPVEQGGEGGKEGVRRCGAVTSSWKRESMRGGWELMWSGSVKRCGFT